MLLARGRKLRSNFKEVALGRHACAAVDAACNLS